MRFGALTALDDVSLRVPRRGFVGLIGPNGAGKTTLFNVVSGFVTPTQGDVRFRGARVTHWPAYRRARVGMARTFQNVGLDKSATVLENLNVALSVGSFRRELWSAVRPRARRGEDTTSQVDEVVDLVDLRSILSVPVADLSTGTAKNVELACALLRRPRMLLLDEPSSGLGPDETNRLLELLRLIHGERDLAILMIEHDMRLTMRAVEYLYVLDFGRILAHGTPAEIRAHPEVIEAYLGVSQHG